MHWLLPLTLALALGGCLSDPKPAQTNDLAADSDLAADPDAAATTDTARDAGPDGDTAPADTSVDAELPPVQVSNAFPPPPATLQTRLRPALVVDLNGDAAADLLLPNLGKDATQQGIFVLLGRASGFGETYDAYLPTKARPEGIAIAHVVGDARPDLLVVGSSGSKSWLEVFAWSGVPGELFARPGLARELTSAPFLPNGGSFPNDLKPVLLTVADYTADGVPDLVTSDLYAALLVSPKAWDGPGLAQAQFGVVAPTTGLWDAIVGLYNVAGGGQNYLMVHEQFGRLNYFPIDAGGLSSKEVVVPLGGNQKGTSPADLDGDGTPDVFGTNGYELSVVRVTPPGGDQLAFEPSQDLAVPDNELDDIHAADLDHNGAIDAVLLDNASTQGAERSAIYVVRDLYVQGSTLRSPFSVASAQFAFGFHPRSLVVGDFDGDGTSEILGFDHDGRYACF
ncbi:MAG: VCBS repeat-containing protein, partial [Myxococcota bacterium]